MSSILFEADGAGAVERPLADKIAEAVSALDYGAAGDGVTDDTAAMLAFFNACIAEGCPGYIPPGTYLITLGELLFDNDNVRTQWPNIMTAGAQAVTFVGAGTANAPIIEFRNGTYTGGPADSSWIGGHLRRDHLRNRHGNRRHEPPWDQSLWHVRNPLRADDREGARRFDNPPDRQEVRDHQPRPLLHGLLRLRCDRGLWKHGPDAGQSERRGLQLLLGQRDPRNRECRRHPLWPRGIQHLPLHVRGAVPGVGNQLWGGSRGADRSKPHRLRGDRHLRVRHQSRKEFGNADITKIRFIHRYEYAPNLGSDDYWPRICINLADNSGGVADTKINVIHRIEAGGDKADLGVFIDGNNTGNIGNVIIDQRIYPTTTGFTFTDSEYYSAVHANAWLRLLRDGIVIYDTMPSLVPIGYRAAAGAGGAVTQTTSRSTAVTLNKLCGQITLVSAAGSTSPTSFTVNNSFVTTGDTIQLSQKSGTDKYRLSVTAVGSGSFQITYATLAGTAVEQPVFTFAIINAKSS